MAKQHVTTTLNGNAVEFLCESRQSLLEVLRDELHLTGTKEGCGTGDCGACTVNVNGRMMCSCLFLGVEAQGKSIQTVEGIANGEHLHVLQRKFIEHAALQCGICTPGMLIAAKTLLDNNLNPTEEEVTTRVPVDARPAPFVAKAVVAALPAMASHQIVTAPMGTVFPLREDEWAALAPLLPDLPPYVPAAAPELTPAFAWEQRGKDVYPLPGGYTGYLESLAIMLAEIEASKPTRELLEGFLRERVGLSETSAHLTVGFFLRIGLVIESSGALAMSPVAEGWLRDRDAAPLIALLHARTKFVGELLAEAREPKSDSDILDLANQFYGANWQTKAQIRRRRGWLESAGMLAETPDGLLQTTSSGRSLVDALELQPRSSSDAVSTVIEEVPAVVDEVPADTEALIARLRAAAVDGTDPDRFERETAEVFRRLGFASQWLGGAGKTDVLLEADLGRDASYRVVVDCKSSGKGAVSQQIDWDTIDEHKTKHRAQYAAIVAGSFGGGRLAGRAEKHEAIMLTVDDLAELLVQHGRFPLGLDVYGLLFTSGSAEDGMAAVGEIAQEAERRVELTKAVLNLLQQYGAQMGALSARDLALLLMTAADLPDATEQEIAEILAPLASRLVGALTSANDHFRPASSAATVAQKLRALADRLDPQGSEIPAT